MEALNILLVDDDADIGKLMKLRLAKEAPDKSFHFVESGTECLEYIKENKVDCIISDYQMPEMNGMELLLELRNQGNDVPFIFLTAQGNEEVARDALKNGADDYFTKDIGFAYFARIINSVEQAVAHRSAETERRRADEALRASQKYLQTIIDTEPECVKLITADGTLLMMNRAGLDMIDADSLDQVNGKSIFGLIVPEYCEAFKALGEKVYQGGTGTLEFDIVGLKGRRIRLETHAVPLRNERDEIIALLGITRDITERKRAEEELAGQREFLVKTLDSLTHPFYVIDANNYQVIMANPAAKLDISPGHKTCYDLTHKLDKPCGGDDHICPLEKVKETKMPVTVEHIHYDKSGNERVVEVHGYPIFDDNGEVSQMIEYALDITARKQAEDALRESEERFHTLFESANDGIFLQEGGVFVDCNSKAVEMYGYEDKSDIIGRHPIEFAPPLQPDGSSSEQKALGFINTVLNGTPQKFYWQTYRKDGSLLDVEVSLNTLKLKGTTYIQAIVRDITERRKAEHEYKTIIETAIDGFWMTDSQGRFVDVNAAYCNLIGYSRSELLNMHISGVEAEEKPEDTAEHMRHIIEYGSDRFQTKHKTKDGRLVDLDVSVTYSAEGGGRFIVFLRDITERKKFDREKEGFYAMVAHDIKSPLTAILGYSELMLTERLDGDTASMIDSIRRSGKRLLSLVEDFLAISKMESEKVTLNLLPSDMALLLGDVCKESECALSEKNLSFNKEFEENPPMVMVDQKLIQRAVSNLLQNAVNYTPAGGEITLRVKRGVGMDEGFVVISVTDTGPGLPADEQFKIFDKYYRSPKTSGIKGTGLGLAIVKAVAEAHGGRVELKSEVGKGSTFSIYLPTGSYPG